MKCWEASFVQPIMHVFRLAISLWQCLGNNRRFDKPLTVYGGVTTNPSNNYGNMVTLFRSDTLQTVGDSTLFIRGAQAVECLTDGTLITILSSHYYPPSTRQSIHPHINPISFAALIDKNAFIGKLIPINISSVFDMALFGESIFLVCRNGLCMLDVPSMHVIRLFTPKDFAMYGATSPTSVTVLSRNILILCVADGKHIFRVLLPLSNGKLDLNMLSLECLDVLSFAGKPSVRVVFDSIVQCVYLHWFYNWLFVLLSQYHLYIHMYSLRSPGWSLERIMWVHRPVCRTKRHYPRYANCTYMYAEAGIWCEYW